MPGMGMPGMASMPGMMAPMPGMMAMPTMMPVMAPITYLDPALAGGCFPTCGTYQPPPLVDVTYSVGGTPTGGPGPVARVATVLGQVPGQMGPASIAGVGAPVSAIPEFQIDPVSGIAWGRWSPGWASMDPNLGNIPANSLHFFAIPTQGITITLPITGTFTYNKVGSTTPTDNLGHQGTLTTATFSANFTANTVNVGVGVTMPNATTVGASANGLVFGAGGNFKTTTPVMSCSGSCGTLSGVIGGQFSPGGVGAGVGYGLTNGTQVINGAAVFRK